MTKVAYIVWTNWRDIRSGVSTFIRLMEPLAERDGVDFRIVEAHVREDAVGNGASEQEVTKATKKRDRLQLSAFIPQPFSLVLGYFRQLLADIRSLWKHRSVLRGRVLVTNEFGCETFPVAMRVLFPFSRIIAIGHTHPGMLTTAQHPVRRMVERLCSASVNDIIFNSASLQATWREKLPSLPRNQVVIHHGLPEPDRTLPDDYPVKPEGCIDFICVARFVYWKGQRPLLEAWQRAASRCSTPIRMVFVGDGDDEGEMKALAEEFGVADSVVFLGAKPGGDLYCNGVDVGVLLSIEPEAFGLVLLEAMSRGKPMISSNMGGFTEIVVDGETGCLVDPKNAESVADAIVSLADDAELRNRMGTASRARWQEHFHVERMLGEYVSVFDGEGSVAGGE